MTTSIILGRKHRSKQFEVVSKPAPPVEQNARFNKMSQGTGNGWAEIYLHEIVLSSGRKQKRFAVKR